jgi:hypothetical protein
MFADAMMKHLHYIFLFMCLALGMSAILQEEQPALRMLTEASADASVTPAPTGCFISMSTDYFSTIAHRPFFNDENNERKINGVLFQENFYNQASAPSKLLKLKIHPSVEEDTHMMYLNQQEEMLYQKNKKHSGKSADKTK